MTRAAKSRSSRRRAGWCGRGWTTWGSRSTSFAPARARTQSRIVGLRLGATLAQVTAAERGDVDFIVLWSPCVSGAGYVTEVTRLHTLYTRIEPHLSRAPRPAADGAEALGMFLPRVLIDELGQLDLLQATRRPAPRALVIDGGGVQGRDALVTRLRELGADTELRSHPGHKFLVTVSHRQVVPEEIIASIAGWVDATHPATAPSRPDEPSPTSTGPAGERPLVFGTRHPLFGILTPGDAHARQSGHPSIVIANAGCVNRQGPHAMFVRMARRWASLGFDVLRIDLAGIGDSPVVPGAAENVTYPDSGMSDLEEAIRATGSERAIVAGLCSGGDYAFQLGSTGTKLAGSWILNPRTFGVLDLTAVESGTPPTTKSVADVPGALRTMASHGVDTTLVVSRGDPGVAYVDAHAGDAMRALSALDGFVRFDSRGRRPPVHAGHGAAAGERSADRPPRLALRGSPSERGPGEGFPLLGGGAGPARADPGAYRDQVTHRGASNGPRVLREGRGHLARQAEVTVT